GWLSLSQARYSLGCHRVSSLQYGATMVPRVRAGAGGALRFQEVPGTGGDPDPQPEGGGSDGLRQRRGPPAKGGVSPRPPPDPLNWFGVLVPPSLRQAQGSFVQGVTVALEVAELQEAVAAATTRYRHLLRRKCHPPGDSETLGDTGTTGDTQTLGDTGTTGDTEDLGDTKTVGTLGDTKTTGDTETLGDTGTLGDTETTEDARTFGDTETTGDTQDLGDTAGDTELPVEVTATSLSVRPSVP
ncbi:coiled-coil domain-containing protein 115, partial [Numenius arquata]|uniref:coiled-coil domain-containing protein 115 n=1 Tax=Numenius arquata TaxID=31919 RepID=UPI003D30D239